MNILGLVMARGGSKRVSNKNIKDFLGKPLIAWTAEVALKSVLISRWILSTEDGAIAEIGRKYGLETPFTQPRELATDTSTGFQVLQYVLKWLSENEPKNVPDWIVLLEPTSPGRQSFHVEEVVKLIQERAGGIDSICGVSLALGNFSAFKSLQVSDKSLLSRYYDNKPFRELLFRNQDVPPSYYINSAIYAFKKEYLLPDSISPWGNKVYGYIMDDKYALDIDTPTDWIVAEAKMKALLEERK